MYSLETERTDEAGRLLTGLISRDSNKDGWRTAAFFDILYGNSDPWRVRVAAAKSLAHGPQLMYFERGNWHAGPSMAMVHQCMRTGRHDIVRELVRRGPMSGYEAAAVTPGATTDQGRWLDALSTLNVKSDSYPELIRWADKDQAAWASILADADPLHGGTDCLHGTAVGAAFFELVMRRAVSAGLDAAPAVAGAAPGPRRRMVL